MAKSVPEKGTEADAAAAEDVGGRIILVFDATSPVTAMRKVRAACHRRRQGRYVGGWLEALFRLLDRQEVVVMLWQNSHRGSPVNEWADIEADEFANAAQDMVPVPRLRCEHASMGYSMPRRSTREWAAANAMRTVQDRLMATVNESAMRRYTDIPPLLLPDRVQQACEAVGSRRSQVGDSRRRVGKAMRAAGHVVACPHGCTDGRGERARFTWDHVQLHCQERLLVGAREEWLAAIRKTAEAAKVGADAPHSDLELTAQLVDKCVQRAARTRLGAAAPEVKIGTAALGRVHRLAASHIMSTGNSAFDRNAAFRKIAREMVEAGAALQITAWDMTKEAEGETLAEVCLARRVAKWVVKLKRLVVEGGPRRAAALRDVDSSARRVEVAADGLIMGSLQGGALTRPDWVRARAWRVKALQLVHGARAAAYAHAKAENPRRGGLAYLDWKHLAMLSRWRLVAAARYRRWGGTACARACTVDVEAWRIARAVLLDSELARRFDISALTDALDGDVGGGRRVDLRVRVPQLREPGRTGSVSQHVYEVCQPRVVSLIGREQEAASRWECGGGRKGELARRSERAKRTAAVRAAVAGAMMQRYFQQQPGASVCGLSGRAAASGSGRMQQAEPVQGGGKPKRRRPGAAPAQVSAYRRGEDHNRFGFWQVERVLEVRLLSGVAWAAAEGSQIEVRLRWVGCNRATGLPWIDSWVPMEAVDADGATKAMLNKPCQDEAETMLRRKYGRRRARKRAAVAPPREFTEAEAEGQTAWRRRLRARNGGAGAAAGGARRKRRIIVSDDEEEVGATCGEASTRDEARSGREESDSEEGEDSADEWADYERWRGEAWLGRIGATAGSARRRGGDEGDVLGLDSAAPSGQAA